MNAIRRLTPTRCLPAAVACLVLVALFRAPFAGAEPVGAVEHLPTRCEVGELLAGPDGNVWFTCFRRGPGPDSAGRAMIGRMTPQGQVSEFGIPARLGIGGIVAGPDGNVWFTLSGGAYPPAKSRPSAIGRVTPGGEMTLFKAGLHKGSAPGEIVAGADGNLWFADTAYGQAPEIGRVSPQGTIAEFPTGVKEPLGLGGLAATPDGSAAPPTRRAERRRAVSSLGPWQPASARAFRWSLTPVPAHSRRPPRRRGSSTASAATS